MRCLPTFKTKISTYSDSTELIGKEFSRNWARKNILKLSDDEIKVMQKEIKEEYEEDKKNGMLPDTDAEQHSNF